MRIHESDGLVILGAIKGLVSEGEEIEKSIRKRKPDLAGISISPAELVGLREYIAQGEPVVELFEHEIAYLELLMDFGEVRAPSPSYTVPVKVTKELGIPLVPMDMDDDSFADVYTRNVSTMNFLSHAMREKKAGRKAFKVKDAEDFVIQWDSSINANKGLKSVEKEREKYMGKKLASLLKKGSVLAVVDVERMDGIIRSMTKYL